jgi:hypothetical protein
LEYSSSTILTYKIVTDKGMSATELTSRSVSRAPEGVRPDVLPALAFCLLFRFQGAVALAHLGGDRLPAWLGAGCSSGAVRPPWSEEKH